MGLEWNDAASYLTVVSLWRLSNTWGMRDVQGDLGVWLR